MAKCDNHPDRDAVTYQGWRGYVLHLCPECTPPWFLDLDEDSPEYDYDGGTPLGGSGLLADGGTV